MSADELSTKNIVLWPFSFPLMSQIYYNQSDIICSIFILEPLGVRQIDNLFASHDGIIAFTRNINHILVGHKFKYTYDEL